MTQENEYSDQELYDMGVIISLARIYDVLLMMLAHQTDEHTAARLREKHSEGKLWMPPPFDIGTVDMEES